jgi:hypothetical protein
MNPILLIMNIEIQEMPYLNDLSPVKFHMVNLYKY